MKAVVMAVMIFAAAAVAGMAPGTAAAGDWQSPPRGSQLRADLMDALRPEVEWSLGAPVEFVVHDLRVKGDRAFAMLTAQRPGGKAIDLARTPMAERGEIDPELASEGAHVEVFWQKSGRVWVAEKWAVGSTDLWYAWQPICDRWGDLIPETCQGL
jgi:hypothetical protein